MGQQPQGPILRRYEDMVNQGTLRRDEQQTEVAARLDTLLQQLHRYRGALASYRDGVQHYKVLMAGPCSQRTACRFSLVRLTCREHSHTHSWQTMGDARSPTTQLHMLCRCTGRGLLRTVLDLCSRFAAEIDPLSSAELRQAQRERRRAELRRREQAEQAQHAVNEQSGEGNGKRRLAVDACALGMGRLTHHATYAVDVCHQACEARQDVACATAQPCGKLAPDRRRAVVCSEMLHGVPLKLQS